MKETRVPTPLYREFIEIQYNNQLAKVLGMSMTWVTPDQNKYLLNTNR